jgi:hypothetical protein
MKGEIREWHNTNMSCWKNSLRLIPINLVFLNRTLVQHCNLKVWSKKEFYPKRVAPKQSANTVRWVKCSMSKPAAPALAKAMPCSFCSASRRESIALSNRLLWQPPYKAEKLTTLKQEFSTPWPKNLNTTNGSSKVMQSCYSTLSS